MLNNRLAHLCLACVLSWGEMQNFALRPQCFGGLGGSGGGGCGDGFLFICFVLSFLP